MKISESLKRFRNEFHLTQKEVARRVSIVPQQWQKYEYDQMSPSAELIVKIAVAFNVSTDYLLGLSNTPKPNHVDENFFLKVAACSKELQQVLKSESATLNKKHQELIGNAETMAAIEEVERGDGLSRIFTSTEEMMEDLLSNA